MNFHEIRFPTAIAFHSTGGPERKTAFVTMSATGKLAALPWRSPGLKLAYNA